MVRVRAEYCDRIAQLNACCQESGNPGGEVATPNLPAPSAWRPANRTQTIIALRNSQQIMTMRSAAFSAISNLAERG